MMRWSGGGGEGFTRQEPQQQLHQLQQIMC